MIESINLTTDQLLILGSYFFTFVLFYVSIAFIFYSVRSSEIRLMRIIRDPRKTGRNRKQISEAISLAEKEKKKLFLWPAILLKGSADHDKKTSTEKAE